VKIDRCIKNFLESYDSSAMESIDKISQEYGLVVNGHTLNLFNIKEAFDTFKDCLSLYARYQIENVNNDKKLTHDQTFSNTMKFIEEKIFGEKAYKYNELPNFVQSYIEGVNQVITVCDHSKSSMSEADINNEFISDINEFCDKFIDIMDQKFTEAMDKVLLASGYTTNKALSDTTPKKKPIFA